MEWIATNLAALDGIAQQILADNPLQRKFALYGEMGAGKTTFVQAFCRQLGFHGTATSPTFALVNRYPLSLPNNPGATEVYHLDLYRLSALEEAWSIGIEEYLDDHQYCFVEWPERIEPLLPPEIMRIKLEIIDNYSRKILFLPHIA